MGEDLIRDIVWDQIIDKLKPGGKAELHMKTQDALYKLAVLGLVRDWTVDYRGQTHYVVTMEDVSAPVEDHAQGSLEAYIRRHDPLFSFESKRPGDRKYIDPCISAPPAERLIRLVEALLMWTNDHIVYGRRQAIKNMLDLCEKMPGKEELRKYINNFFLLDTEGGPDRRRHRRMGEAVHETGRKPASPVGKAQGHGRDQGHIGTVRPLSGELPCEHRT